MARVIAKRILIDLSFDELMLIIEHPSAAVYRNQIGGYACWQAELEGVLAPLEVLPETTLRLQQLEYEPREGISTQRANAIDTLLASEATGRFVKVDRERLQNSWEAWVHVSIDSPKFGEPQLRES